MALKQRAKLFQNGASQAVRLPQSCRFPDDSTEVAVRRGGRRVILEPLDEWPQSPSDLCVSAITVAALRYGAQKRKSSKLHTLIDTFIGSVEAKPVGELEAARYGQLTAELESLGTPICQFDTMIAAHALTLGLVLVTNNTRHFSQVRGLECEDWL